MKDSAMTNKRGCLKNMDTHHEDSPVTAWKRHRGTWKNMGFTPPFAIICGRSRQLQGFLVMVTCLITSTYAHNTGVPAGRPSTSPSPYMQSVPLPCWSYECEASLKLKLPIRDYIAWRWRSLLQQNLDTAVLIAARGTLNTHTPSSQTKDISKLLDLHVTSQLSTPSSSTRKVYESLHALKMKTHHRSKKEARESLDFNTEVAPSFQSKIHSFSSTSTVAKRAWHHALESWVASLFGGKRAWSGKSQAHQDESRIMVSNDAKIRSAANDLKFRPWMGRVGHPFGLFSGNVKLPGTTHLPISELIPKVLQNIALSTTEPVSSSLVPSILNKTHTALTGKDHSALTCLDHSSTSDTSLDLNNMADPASSLGTMVHSQMSDGSLARSKSSEISSNLGLTESRITQILGTSSSIKHFGSAAATDSLSKQSEITTELAEVSKLVSPSSSSNAALSFKPTSNKTFHEGNTSSVLVQVKGFPNTTDLDLKMQPVGEGVTHEDWIASDIPHQSVPGSANLLTLLDSRSLSSHMVRSGFRSTTAPFRLGFTASAVTSKPELILPTVSRLAESITEIHGFPKVSALSVSENAADLTSKMVSVRRPEKYYISSNTLILPGPRSTVPFKFSSTEKTVNKISSRSDPVSSTVLPSMDWIPRVDPAAQRATSSFWVSSPSIDTTPAARFTNIMNTTSTKGFTKLASSLFPTVSESGAHVVKSVTETFILGALTSPYLPSTNSTYSTVGKEPINGNKEDADIVTQLPHEALLSTASDLSAKLNATVPLKHTPAFQQQYASYSEALQEKSASTTDLPPWPIQSTPVMPGYLTIHEDFPKLTLHGELGGPTSTEKYVSITGSSMGTPSHQTNIIEGVSPTDFIRLIPFTATTGQRHAPIPSPTTEQNVSAVSEDFLTTSNLSSLVSKGSPGIIMTDYLPMNASNIVSSNSTTVSVMSHTSLYQAMPELILSTQKETNLVPSTNASSSLSVMTDMATQSHVTSEQVPVAATSSVIPSPIIVTQPIGSLAKSNAFHLAADPSALLSTVTSFPVFKSTANLTSSSTPRTLTNSNSSGSLQLHIDDISGVSGIALEASQTAYSSTLKSFSTIAFTEPLTMGTEISKTKEYSTHPTTMINNLDAHISLPGSLNVSRGGSVPNSSGLSVAPSYEPPVVKKNVSLFSLKQSTVLATTDSRFMDVLYNITSMLQLDAVVGGSSSFSGLTKLNHSTVINVLPALQSGAPTIRTNRSKRTLPTGHLDSLTQPVNMRNNSIVFTSCLTCTSAAPVLGNWLLLSSTTAPSPLVSSTLGPNLNGGDWPKTTFTESDIKVSPASKLSTQIPHFALMNRSVPPSYSKMIENVSGASMINASESNHQWNREAEVPLNFTAHKKENAHFTASEFLAASQIATTTDSSDLLHTKVASWRTKLPKDRLTTLTMLSLSKSTIPFPSIPERFDMEKLMFDDLPDLLQPTGTEASIHTVPTVTDNVMPSTISSLLHNGFLGTEPLPNFSLLGKETVLATSQPTASSTSIAERGTAHPSPSLAVWKRDLSTPLPASLTRMLGSEKPNASSISIRTSAAYTKMQHADLDYKVLAASSSRSIDRHTATTGSYSVAETSLIFNLSSVVESNINASTQPTCQNAICAQSSYFSPLQLNVTAFPEVSSSWKPLLPRTINFTTEVIFRSLASTSIFKLSPTNLFNGTSKRLIAFVYPTKVTSTVVHHLPTNSTDLSVFQHYSASLQPNDTARSNYSMGTAFQAPHWISSTTMVLLDDARSTGHPHLQPPITFTQNSTLVTPTLSDSITSASLGAVNVMKLYMGRTSSPGTVGHQHYTASPHILLNSTAVPSSYSTMVRSMSLEKSHTASLLSNNTHTHPDLHSSTAFRIHQDYSNRTTFLSLLSSTSRHLSSLSIGTLENATLSSSWLSLSEPTRESLIGTRPAVSLLASAKDHLHSTRSVSLLSSAKEHHLGTSPISPLASSQILDARISSQLPLHTAPVASSTESFLTTKLAAAQSRTDPILIREPKITSIQSRTYKMPKWVTTTTVTKIDTTLLEPLASQSDEPLFELPTKRISTLVQTSLPNLRSLPLRFRITGIQFIEEFQNQSASAYKKLEHEVILTLNKMFYSKYDKRYLQTSILHFLNGSVVVECEIEFRKDLPVPSSSDIIRTVTTDVYRKTYSSFNWSIDVHSLQSKNYTLQNLEPERLSLSFCTLRVGFLQSTMGLLSSLEDEVVQALHLKFAIRRFRLVEVRNIKGDLYSRGDLYIETQIHADVHQILQLLKHLVNQSIDLTSLSVDGVRLDLQVFPISLRITDRKFDEKLLDHSSTEFQNLTRSLSAAVLQALRKDFSPLQVVIRDVLSGSMICRGDLIFQRPAPASQDILQTLSRSVDSDKVLAGSTFHVDPFSFTVGDSKPHHPFEYADFPGFAVAIIVMCGLGILFIPILVILFLKSGLLGRRSKATIQGRREEIGQCAVELDNRGFCSVLEQP
ncbi:uncharacterized threonine-rich GPI-anchored glycoprotein PJ4664.02-like [Rhinatrema bivittatum]|uniref:uncharacterized threonine-rich GPI-anchored glycoprotein PJ4664.02-like n=1 Tax=Rhinatrema bivittatum TaxID=194408 RepID=UPI001127E036|nr:uncharacterized threonine-rich GPI-anchored glycoprotein PJ4664.02-like [Rhinatrema bivittatum]XP_029431300.1 uncharacterized threonine-rich GPI-anchored glycoprotein PJ4664.02-like [Rhinatrema bivittatum]XP_029431301.1 uncharacterized threonine-rich GPI-anchored glycoprotein PJ4664.02-like [Rhinatrema bivittatum]